MENVVNTADSRQGTMKLSVGCRTMFEEYRFGIAAHGRPDEENR